MENTTSKYDPYYAEVGRYLTKCRITSGLSRPRLVAQLHTKYNYDISTATCKHYEFGTRKQPLHFLLILEQFYARFDSTVHKTEKKVNFDLLTVINCGKKTLFDALGPEAQENVVT